MSQVEKDESVSLVKKDRSGVKYGSDLMAELIAGLDVPFIALNPGASFRGLHDSLINHPTVGMPELITCTHEEISVDVAHGYAKATGQPMGAAIHNVVGLQHATMAIYDAWCDRAPVLLFGGTGPMEVEKRRPGSDWLHTALVQGNLIRDFVKWDDQPASLLGLSDSIYRAYRISVTEPAGPIYVCFDAQLQEKTISEKDLEEHPELSNPPAMSHYVTSSSPAPDPQSIDQIAKAIREAEWPVILADYTGRSDEAFYELSELAEEWAIPVLDFGSRFNMATNHSMNLTGPNFEVLEKADVIVALDMKDLYGALSRIERTLRIFDPVLQHGTRVFSISLQEYSISSWSLDFQRLYPTELNVLADTKLALQALREKLNRFISNTTLSTHSENKKVVNEIEATKQKIEPRRLEITQWHEKLRSEWKEIARQKRSESPIATSVMADELWNILKDKDFVLANGNLKGWTNKIFTMEKPRQYLGTSGGGGLGYGIGATIGACLAHRDTGKLVVDIQSDGDLLFTAGGLWTLAHHQLPALIVMFNNRSYYNSEEHQMKIAQHRGRNVERAGIGTRIDNPSVNFAHLAESMGIDGIGPITNVDDIGPALKRALDIVEIEKRSVLVDVVTQAR